MIHGLRAWPSGCGRGVAKARRQVGSEYVKPFEELCLSHDGLVERRHAARGDVGALEFRDEAAVADDADAVPDIGLQIHVGSRRDKGHNLPARIDERELRCTGPLRNDGAEDADRIILTGSGVWDWRDRGLALLRRGAGGL